MLRREACRGLVMEMDPGPERTPADARAAELNELLHEYLERAELEGESALEGLCREHPGLAQALRRRVGVLGDAGLLKAALAPATDRLPDRLGDFRLISKLGAGGMGVVFLAHEESLDREVALKVVRPEQLYFGEARERFAREVTTVARLSHPGIVPVFSVGEEEGLPFFAMERIHGATLADVLRHIGEQDPGQLEGADLDRAIAASTGEPMDAPRDPLFRGSWNDACVRIVHRIGEALEHAHGLGVLHRDVKPSNVMVTRDGRVMLVDFGLSSEERADRLTRTGSRVGSVPYMAPEQLAGDSPADERSDVYGLGVTFYELLCLRLPYRARTVTGLRDRALEGRPRPIREQNSKVSWEAQTVCLTAMELDPSRRYASVAELVRDLANVIARRPISARPAGRWLLARRWIERHPVAALGAVLGFLLLVVAPGLFAWQQLRAGERLARKNDELGATLLEVARQHQRAEANFDLANAAVGRMLTRVGDETLRGLPRVDEVRRGLLLDALEFEEALLSQDPRDLQQRRQYAKTLQRAAEIQAYLGHYEDAARRLEQCQALLESIRAEQPSTATSLALAECLYRLAETDKLYQRHDAAEARLRLALETLDLIEASDLAAALLRGRLLVEMGDLLQRAGRFDEAGPIFGAATNSLRPMASAESLDARTLLAKALHLRGTPAHLMPLDGEDQAQAQARRAYLEEAIELRSSLVDSQPGQPEPRKQLAQSLNSLGNVFLSSRGSADAEPVFLSALEIFESLRQEHPGVSAYLEGEAVTCMSLGTLTAKQGRRDESADWGARALDALEELVAGDPENLDYRQKCMFAAYSLGHTRMLGGGESGEVEPLLQRAIELGDDLTERIPMTPVLRGTLFHVHADAAYVHGEAGRYAEGRLEALRMLEFCEETNEYAIVAAYLSEFAGLTAGDASVAEQERRDLGRRIESEAIDALGRALESTPDPGVRRQILANPSLEYLRSRESYAELIGGLGLGPAAGGE